MRSIMPCDLSVPSKSASPCAPDGVEYDLDANAASPHLTAAWEAYCDVERRLAACRSIVAYRATQAAVVAQARKDLAQLVGAQAHHIIFTSGGSEADALALLGTLTAGSHLLTSPFEHPAIDAVAADLVANKHITRSLLRTDIHGRISLTAAQDALRARPQLCSCLLAHNETGVVQPIAELAQMCAASGTWLHTDAVQSFGRLGPAHREPSAKAQLVTLAGHKIGAVGGIGALIVRPPALLSDIHGIGAALGLGNPATTPAASAASLVAAVAAPYEQATIARLTSLRDSLEHELVAAKLNVVPIGACHPRLCNTSMLHFVGVEADAVMMALDVAGIATSTGSACASGSTVASPALLALGLSDAEARACLRVSFQREATRADKTALVAALVPIVRQLQRLSR